MINMSFIGQWIFVATPFLMSFARTRMFSSASVKFREGGVSMVQGASRGIGLEFVSPFPFPLIKRKNFAFVQIKLRNIKYLPCISIQN